MSLETFSNYVNDQGTFLNSCSKVISQIPVLGIAYLSNTIDNSYSDNVLNLNPICLTWCDFKNLFFTSNSGAFWINPAGANSCAISLNQQTYESTQKKCLLFNLVEQVKKAWSVKNSKLESSIPPQYNLQLNKESFYYSSLASSTFANGLSLDQVISTLLSNNQIVTAESSCSANVKFTVSFRFTYKPLDTSILVNFNYITKIPCFRNNESCDFCPYSNANQNCRDCIDVKDDSSIASFLNENHTNNFEEYNYEIQNLNGDASIASESSSHYLTKIIDAELTVKHEASITSGSTW
jgi:hypothetical protein